MSNTKENILATALKLFNEKGLAEVSLRNISDEMNISVGNLQYHFKKRDEIIERLFEEMCQEIDSCISWIEVQQGTKLLHVFIDSVKISLDIFFNYRFFFLDFMQIIRKYPEIRLQHHQSMQLRKKAFMNIVNVLVAEGLMREQELPDEYENLFERQAAAFAFLGPSLFLHSEVLEKEQFIGQITMYSQGLYPYLTAAGKAEYCTL